MHTVTNMKMWVSTNTQFSRIQLSITKPGNSAI